VTTPEPNDSRSRAGAYGFSRFEVGALLLVVLIAAGLGLHQWWRSHTAAVAAPWIIEAAVIDGHRPPSDGGGDSARADSRRLAPAPEVAVDVNAAEADELVRLPGIGPVLAGRIVAERERGGPFSDLSDLQRVPGIGAGKTRSLVGWVTFSSSVQPDTVGGQ